MCKCTAKSQCNPSSLEISSFEKVNPGIKPRFFSQKIEQKLPEKEEPVEATVEVAVATANATEEIVVAQRKEKAAKTAAKFAQETEVEPMSADEMKALIAQAKEAEGDDCLMCGS